MRWIKHPMHDHMVALVFADGKGFEISLEDPVRPGRVPDRLIAKAAKSQAISTCDVSRRNKSDRRRAPRWGKA